MNNAVLQPTLALILISGLVACEPQNAEQSATVDENADKQTAVVSNDKFPDDHMDEPMDDEMKQMMDVPVAGGALPYPVAKKVAQTDNYFGTDVEDPYRWLEDDVRESADVSAWVDAENAVTTGYLESLDGHSQIEARLTELWNYERYSVPFSEGGRIFYSKNDGLQNQSVLYVQDNADAQARVLIDPNSWSADGTVALAEVVPSPNGKLLAYGVQDGGSDWRTWKIMDIDSGKVLGDGLEWLKFTSASWAKDNSGFYYSRYPVPEEGSELQSLNLNQAVYFHKVGTPQTEDVLIHSVPDQPEWGHFLSVSNDGRFLIITTWVGTDSRYRITVKDLQNDTTTELIDNFEYDYSFVHNVGDKLYFQSNNGAPKNRVIAIDLNNPATENWQEIIPESTHVLTATNVVGGQFFAQYLEDAKSAVRIFNLDGTGAGQVDLPGIGSAGGFGGDADDDVTYFSYSSFNAPPTIYRYDIETGERHLFKQASVDFDPNDYVIKQIFYTSKDGTRVPMFIGHKKGLDLSQTHPALLYAYGGFDISLTPGFSVRWLSWMEMGGVFALANIRGGGEYGRDWHKAGTKLQKQNVFDDFIAAGEYLIDNSYTRREQLAVMGGSNGGLLVGAVVNQRPELFGAALPMVGVMDMLRFHQFTAGRFWTDDYGSAENNIDEFNALYAYSPYHNLQEEVEYPAVLVTTADRDDRVVPGHSFKYAARLQEVQAGDAPVIIRIETRAGHGAGTATKKAIELLADQYTFLAANLGMEIK